MAATTTPRVRRRRPAPGRWTAGLGSTPIGAIQVGHDVLVRIA